MMVDGGELGFGGSVSFGWSVGDQNSFFSYFLMDFWFMVVGICKLG